MKETCKPDMKTDEPEANFIRFYIKLKCEERERERERENTYALFFFDESDLDYFHILSFSLTTWK